MTIYLPQEGLGMTHMMKGFVIHSLWWALCQVKMSNHQKQENNLISSRVYALGKDKIRGS